MPEQDESNIFAERDTLDESPPVVEPSPKSHAGELTITRPPAEFWYLPVVLVLLAVLRAFGIGTDVPPEEIAASGETMITMAIELVVAVIAFGRGLRLRRRIASPSVDR